MRTYSSTRAGVYRYGGPLSITSSVSAERNVYFYIGGAIFVGGSIESKQGNVYLRSYRSDSNGYGDIQLQGGVTSVVYIDIYNSWVSQFSAMSLLFLCTSLTPALLLSRTG